MLEIKRDKEEERKNVEANNVHYVVGVGASAGGMEAIHELFDNIPAETGFSFVVIQHLSPDHKSLMGELLAKHTMMKVYEAEDGMLVKSNCIYVIPSRMFIIIKHGRLHLMEKLKSQKPNNAVDVFFESLAEEKKDKSIGIILSGTGTDGTKGVQAIKKSGGFVIVQDPLTAAFDGMPVSAISGGYVDLILAPEMMGEELLESLRESPLLKSFSLLNQKEEVSLREILEMVHHETNLDFGHYKRPTLFRRLAKRMSELGINSIEDYKKQLKNKPGELKSLSKEFLINVTRFFRDTEAFDELRKKIFPAMLAQKKAGDVIKIWSVACSSGEEPYSLAMVMHECLLQNKILDIQVKIFATDIDNDALEQAGRGIYKESVINDVPPAMREKYFIKEEDVYRISPVIRKMVVFANHDILKDPPFSRLDLISCRNMLIYVSPLLQNKILQKFHFALNIDSYLLLGTSENIGILKDAMEEVNRKWKIYRCINKANITDRDSFMAPLSTNGYSFNALPRKDKNALNNLSDIFKDTLLDEKTIAGIFIDKEMNVKQAIGSFKAFLDFPEKSFNLNLLKMVKPDLAVALGIAIRKSMIKDEKIALKKVVIHEGEKERYVNIIVRPYVQQKEFIQSFLFVIIEEIDVDVKILTTVNSSVLSDNDRFVEMEKELRDTRENLQAVIEELESANEEMQSTNEEMISTNEELQSTNEELQSLNEELHTVSAEHQVKIKELIELNDDLDNYFTNSDIGQILVDKKLNIRKYSPAVTQIINLIYTDIGRSVLDITTRITNLNFINDIKEVANTEVSIEREIELDNHRFYLMRINPYRKKNKTADGIVINFIDITESKKLSSIIEGIFDSSLNGITAKKAIRDEQNKIIDFEFVAVNNAYQTQVGKNESELIGKRLLTVLPEVNAEYLEKFIEVVESDKTVRFEHYRAGTGKWFETIAVKMMDGIVTTHSDITDKKKAADVIARNFEDLKSTSMQLIDSNAQLERSNFDLMQFASVASHDLKEPLRKIQAFGNILQTKLKSKIADDEASYLNKMISASGRMQTLIEDVLTLSKLSNSDVSFAKIEISRIVNRITEDLEITIHEKNAKINIGSLPHLEAIPGQIHQLFQNLITNALKFNNKEVPEINIYQGEISKDMAISLGIAYPENYVNISVQDNGIGFEPAYNEKIFGIFQRLNGKQYEGTGIGLAIAKKIVENHCGFIVATSEVNNGATFKVILPINFKMENR